MSTHSYILNHMQEHKETWRDDIGKKRITIHQEGSYAIFNYGPGCDFNDPIIQEARGIIIDTERGSVVCWPFRKFGNWNEEYSDGYRPRCR